MAFSIRLSDQERQLFESYAKLHAISLGDAFKKAMYEKIEEEYDYALWADAYREYEQSGRKSRPASEFWEEVGL